MSGGRCGEVVMAVRLYCGVGSHSSCNIEPVEMSS